MATYDFAYSITLSGRRSYFYQDNSIIDSNLANYTGRYFLSTGINNNGVIVGKQNPTGALADAEAFLFANNVITNLGTLGGTGSSAIGINDMQQVVGFSETGSATHAFIWDADNGIRNLNQLLANPGEWELERANDINNNGQIVGYGDLNGSRRAFMLTPYEPELNIHTAVELEWHAVSGVVYQVQWNTNLNTAAWYDYGEPIIGTGLTNQVFDSTKENPKRFYRLDVQ